MTAARRTEYHSRKSLHCGRNGTPDRWKDPRSVFLRHAALDDRSRRCVVEYLSRAGLAVAQEQVSLPVVRPLKRPDFVPPAPDQEQKSDERGRKRLSCVLTIKHESKTPELFCGQIALAALTAVASETGTRIAAFRMVTVDCGLAHDDRQDRGRAVCRYRRRMQGRKPSLDVLLTNVGDLTSLEPGEYLVPEIDTADPHGPGFPVPTVGQEDPVRECFENCVVWKAGRISSLPHPGEKARRAKYHQSSHPGAKRRDHVVGGFPSAISSSGISPPKALQQDARAPCWGTISAPARTPRSGATVLPRAARPPRARH